MFFRDQQSVGEHVKTCSGQGVFQCDQRHFPGIPEQGSFVQRFQETRIHHFAGDSVALQQTGNFVECCKTRKPTISPAETGARASILCLLCNISYVYDAGFDWDPKKNVFAHGTGDPLWLKRPVNRNGWDVKL